MLCIPLDVCSPSLAQSTPESPALPVGAQPVPPTHPLLTTPRAGSGYGWASAGTEEKHRHHGGQEDKVPVEPGCPSPEPWGGKCPSAPGSLGSPCPSLPGSLGSPWDAESREGRARAQSQAEGCQGSGSHRIRTGSALQC